MKLKRDFATREPWEEEADKENCVALSLCLSLSRYVSLATSLSLCLSRYVSLAMSLPLCLSLSRYVSLSLAMSLSVV